MFHVNSKLRYVQVKENGVFSLVHSASHSFPNKLVKIAENWLTFPTIFQAFIINVSCFPLDFFSVPFLH